MKYNNTTPYDIDWPPMGPIGVTKFKRQIAAIIRLDIVCFS